MKQSFLNGAKPAGRGGACHTGVSGGLRRPVGGHIQVEPQYWLDLFTVETWEEFRSSGMAVSGFRERRWSSVKKIREGDLLMCYLTGLSRWVGMLEVEGEPFYDTTPIWSSEAFPSRVHVRPLIILDPEKGVPVLDMREELSVFQGLSNPNMWSGNFRGSPYRWSKEDGDAILRALDDAKVNPVVRPLGKVRKVARALTETGVDMASASYQPSDDEEATSGPEGTAHTEIQHRLMRLGADLGFQVHVAKNDRNRMWQGQRLGELPRVIESLPHTFDAETTKTIELIDVLWLSGNAFVAAFEIESTTSVHSGLLRMSDLLAQQPNISIPLFIVAPEARRMKVVREVNRPTFGRVSPPLVDICRFISFENLKEQLDGAAQYVKFLKPDWLQTVSESCSRDED